MVRITGLLLLAIIATACAPVDQEPSGVVITNARVIDGSGGPSRDVSVRIVGQRIDAVGEFEPQSGDTVVDAAGMVLSPGFIDVHSHHERSLLEIPDALGATNQGITTIVGGQDGGHPYPLADYFASIEAAPVAVNVSAYAGHGTIRGEVLGDDYQRHATHEELAAMIDMLNAELAAGALGLSSGLEYDPGSFSAPEEVITLAKVAAAADGRYISHIRSEDQYFWEAIDEIINIGREAELPVQVTHIKLALRPFWGQADRLIETLESARAEGIEITADIYPYTAWNTGFSWLTTLFPERDLDRREGAEYILNDMLSPETILLPEFSPEPAYSGMTVAEISEIRGTDPETTLMDLLKMEAAAGNPSSMIGFAMDEPDIETIMAWSQTIIGSDGELDGPHPRGFGAFTRFLGHYVRNREVVSLEKGIRKMTSQSAAHMGIRERGLIEPGYYADLVLFDPENVGDRATFIEPHLTSVGVHKVWVNGEVVLEDGAVTGNRPGMIIRRTD